jgi:hypothetical protein
MLLYLTYIYQVDIIGRLRFLPIKKNWRIYFSEYIIDENKFMHVAFFILRADPKNRVGSEVSILELRHSFLKVLNLIFQVS